MKQFTQSQETFEVELFGVEDEVISSLEFGLYSSNIPRDTYGNIGSNQDVIIKTLGNGITLVDNIATIRLSATDITYSGCYHVEVRYSSDTTTAKNLDIRPNKLKFTHSKLANS